MTPESKKRLLRLVDRIWKHFCDLSGAKNYDASMKALQGHFRRYPSLSVWAHDIARDSYPMPVPDTVQPENLTEIIGLIDNKKKFAAVLSNMPEDVAPKLEAALQWMLKQWLPSMREDMKLTAKQLPQHRRGGRRTKMPSASECRQICNEISKLHKEGVLLGDAQRRVADRTGKSLRMIQRVWAARKLKGSSRSS